MAQDTELCFEDRACLGAVAEIFGPIYEPLYILRFESQSDIDPRAVVGAPIFFASEAAKKVDQAACLVKGSDASNIHDEEPGEDEVQPNSSPRTSTSTVSIYIYTHMYACILMPQICAAKSPETTKCLETPSLE